jgi:predicted esterase YcpF (UPF0227 family)
MAKPIIRIYTATDEYIDREMNADEFAQYKIDQADFATKKAQEEAKAAEKQAILDRLGLTADELQTILG